MIRTQLQLTEQQAHALKALAQAQGVSVADLIRRGVDYVLHATPTTSTDERRHRALAAAGQFRSTVSNLGTEHDHYLAEAFGDGVQ